MALILLCSLAAWSAQPPHERVLLESIAVTERAQLPPQKIEAGLVLAFQASARYELVTLRDSVAQQLRRAGISVDSIAVVLGARWRASVECDRFENLLRTELVLRSPAEVRRGIGYGLIRHRWARSDEPVADPALLEALERALCVAVGDTLLYARTDSASGIRPAALVAVTSMELRDNPSVLPRWELFEDAIATSYSGVLAAITGAQRSPWAVTLDVDTRDSIYAQFRLYGAEPLMPPSEQELAALAFFGVEAVVSGALVRTTEGARIELRLWRIGANGSRTLIRQREALLNDDSKVKYLETVAELGKALLAEPLPPDR
ncbi:MAG: hypothetical protein D6747_05940 [Chlorobiota bacterium]|nr:MAG: hypothetical protein D6747_05940 [Chlorobiota bacterium]